MLQSRIFGVFELVTTSPIFHTVSASVLVTFEAPQSPLLMFVSSIIIGPNIIQALSACSQDEDPSQSVAVQVDCNVDLASWHDYSKVCNASVNNYLKTKSSKAR